MLGKLDEVHASYSHVFLKNRQLKDLISFFQLLRAMWHPKATILKEIVLVVNNLPSAPRVMGITWKNFNMMTKELPQVEDEDKSLRERMITFRGLQKWDIPKILIEDS